MSTFCSSVCKLLKIFLEACLVALCVVPVLLLRLLSPFFVVRFGVLRSERLGHFAANTELYLCEQEERSGSRVIDIFCPESKFICNRKLLSLWKNCAGVVVWPRSIVVPLSLANKLLPIYRLPSVPEPLQQDRDINGLLLKYSPHIHLSEEDISEAKFLLAKLGIPSESKHICLTVRDKAYLTKYLPNNDYSYHDYRDANIDNFLEASEYLAENGFYVFRMGVHVERKLTSTHPRVIDYANLDIRSELLDIYLASTCEFCITQGTGFDALPVIFRRPLLQVNAVPVGYAFTYLKDSMFIPKHIEDIKTNRRLPLEEIMDRGLFYSLTSSDYSSHGVRTVENTSEEILDAVAEMLDYYYSSTKVSRTDKQLRFEQIFFSNDDNSCNSIPINRDMRAGICRSFLERNPYYVYRSC